MTQMEFLLRLPARGALMAALLVSSASAPVLANQATAPRTASGIETAWNLRAILDDLLKDNEKLDPLLDQMHPREWAAEKGASESYIQQWQTARDQWKDLVASVKSLNQKNESLPRALDTYFRLEALEVTARSLEEAVSRYGERSTSEQLSGLIARNFSRRERFRDYIRDLSVSAERNLTLMDEEAQRCRGMISKEPAKTTSKR